MDLLYWIVGCYLGGLMHVHTGNSSKWVASHCNDSCSACPHKHHVINSMQQCGIWGALLCDIFHYISLEL